MDTILCQREGDCIPVQPTVSQDDPKYQTLFDAWSAFKINEYTDYCNWIESGNKIDTDLKDWEDVEKIILERYPDYYEWDSKDSFYLWTRWFPPYLFVWSYSVWRNKMYPILASEKTPRNKYHFQDYIFWEKYDIKTLCSTKKFTNECNQFANGYYRDFYSFEEYCYFLNKIYRNLEYDVVSKEETGDNIDTEYENYELNRYLKSNHHVVRQDYEDEYLGSVMYLSELTFDEYVDYILTGINGIHSYEEWNDIRLGTFCDYSSWKEYEINDDYTKLYNDWLSVKKGKFIDYLSWRRINRWTYDHYLELVSEVVDGNVEDYNNGLPSDYFVQIEEPDGDYDLTTDKVYYFDYYVKTSMASRLSFDDPLRMTTYRLLDLKNKKANAVEHYAESLLSVLDHIKCPIRICVVPSHLPGDATDGGIWRILSENELPDNCTVDNVLVRVVEVEPKHKKEGGFRGDPADDVITIIADGVVPGENYLVLDDITTTGASMVAARHLLKNAGAKSTYHIAFGKTIRYY